MGTDVTGSVSGPQIVRRPLLPVAMGFILGVIAGPSDALWLDLSITIALLAVVIWLARARRVLSYLLLPLLFIFVGAVAATLRLPPTQSITAQPGMLRWEGAIIEGFVVEAPEIGPDSERLIVDVVGTSSAAGLPLAPASGRVALWIRRPGGAAKRCGQPGDRIRAWARLRLPLEALIPGRPSTRALAARRGITLFGGVGSSQQCVLVAPRSRTGVRLEMERLRDRLHAAIDRGLPARRASVVRAFATGDRSGIPRDLDEAFQASGLSHLLAVSGLNLAIIAGIFATCLAMFFRLFSSITLGFGAWRLAAVIALPFVVLYTMLVGASPSAVRAAVMVVALLGAQVARRTTEPWTALAIATLVIVAWDPAALGDVSFQLSFAAVAGLFRIYPALRKRFFPNLASWVALRRWPIEIALASAAATIGTAPLVARQFHRISVIGFAANVPAAPISSLVLVPLSLLGGMLGTISDELAAPVLMLAGWASDLLCTIARESAGLPGAAWRIPRPSMIECGLFYLGTISLSASLPTRRSRRFGYACLLACAVVFAGFQAARSLSDELRVTFLPVGQGDAIVAELPGGRVLVVDTGPAGHGRTAAERVIVPYLRYRRITHIDILALSHPHQDHVGGVAALAEEFPIGEVWWTGDRRESRSAHLDVLTRLPTRIVTASTAPSMVGGVTIEPLGPVGAAASYPVVNNGSMVLKLIYGERAILLTGDVHAEAEAVILERFGDRLRADVLKAGHHGSRTSSTEPFVDRVAPTHAIITVGEDNRWGFPSDEVLARLEAHGAQIWRTDRHAAVTVRTDGESLVVESHRPRTAEDQVRAAATSAP